ncbi:prokaryotic metallothionein family protein [Lyngbya aestuarii BL J]|uniref:Prokaryotic metallothionein family protein n=2 Tax=Lyngbya aestuarii TaxID=118322 RepID=U7QGK6_9CYAN|nr:prokaryotic metallothionein family protein [Lyngbya aestuarii BL J]
MTRFSHFNITTKNSGFELAFFYILTGFGEIYKEKLKLYLNICSDVKLKIEAHPENIAMSAVTQMKCACESCLCVVSLENAIKKDGKPYCSEACANGHPSGSGCGHTGCTCGS